MNVKKKRVFHSAVSCLLAIVMLMGLIPSVYAAQDNEYVDPADRWLTASGRTNELDVNAALTNETQYCSVCNKDTTVLTYRVPEYTKSGSSALNRNVKFSDGTTIDGNSQGNLDDGTPGVNAYYTGYHWTKAVCQNCGTINAIEGTGYYSFDKNVYGLNSCDRNFFLDFDNTAYTPHNSNYHNTVLKKGQYCQFCKGTFARATTKQEAHDFTETVDGQIGNNRFYVASNCDECKYTSNEYVTAKSVVSSYYGKEDGGAHTITVSDLSESGVNSSIRYGDSADKCTLSSAPSYTKPGYYTVYYKINYSYAGESMMENGVSYVWLLEESNNQDSNELPHVHDYSYLETVPASCTNLGYDRFQCKGCGSLQKTNYTPANGHNHEKIIMREASCTQGGSILNLCNKCGDFYTETTPITDHNYSERTYNPTCRNVGYSEHICNSCGYKYVSDIVPLVSHAYEKLVKAPTCSEKGYTNFICVTCAQSYVNDYTEPTGHEWDAGHIVTSSTCEGEGVIEFHCENCEEKMIKAESAGGHQPGAAPTCTKPQICLKCNAILALPIEHSYTEKITAPTCTAMGNTLYSCACGNTYEGDYTEKIPHNYLMEITKPTCSAMGFTNFTCSTCGDSYKSEYTDKTPHNYTETVTAPTCTELGFSVFDCTDCAETYTGNYVNMVEHNYHKQTIDPTCTEHGYSVYTCPDCGKSFIDDFTDCKNHHYKETITAPTCTEMGFTFFECEECDDSYIGNYTNINPHSYFKTVTAPSCTQTGFSVFTCSACGDNYKTDYTDKIPHTYKETITAPSCVEMGFTVYACADCGKIYKGNYIEALGHTPTEWIIDTPATIEHGGSKHIECSVCGDVMQTVELKQLLDKDITDEDGKATVAGYNILLTDENAQPIFNAEIMIDIEDHISILLQGGRLLDYEDRTVITVTHTETDAVAGGLNIAVSDENSNAATGTTNENGQLTVPNGQSSTGDSNGTIGGGEENKFTYVVTVTNKENIVTPNCDISIGESNDIVIDLPDGNIMTRETPIIVTVTDQNGTPQTGVNVIALGDKDYIEKGSTDIYGKVTLPQTDKGYTDEDGKVNVDGYNVVVADENSFIQNAFVTHTAENTITVLLPETSLIDYANRITVTVLDKDGAPTKDMSVTVSDVTEKTNTQPTNETGQITVPPLNEDYTDTEGNAKVNGFHILVHDETKPVENAFITIVDGKINVKLLDTSTIDIENRITVTVLDKDGEPVKDMSVTVSDIAEKTNTQPTDENGQMTVPPLSEDYTDKDGTAAVNEYTVIVEDTKAKIENAYVTITDGKISVLLPDTHTLTTANQTTVTITDKGAKPVSNMSVTVNDKDKKTAAKSTDASGKITVPVKYSGGGSSGGGGGGGSYISNTVNVKVTDQDGKAITNFTKSVDSKGNVTVTLPKGTNIEGGNYFTITLTDSKGGAKADITVTLKDKENHSADGVTDKSGTITLPANTHNSYIVGYPDGNFMPEGNMTRAEAAAIFARLIAEEKGEKISGTKTSFKDVSANEWYSSYIAYLEKYEIVKGYGDSTFRPDNTVTRSEFVAMCVRFYGLFEKVSAVTNTAKYTDVDGGYWAVKDISFATSSGWLNGYVDGTFKGDSNITRSEVVTVVNRTTGRKADSKFIDSNLSTLHTFKDLKNKGYWAYYEILEASNTHKVVSHANGETWIK